VRVQAKCKAVQCVNGCSDRKAGVVLKVCMVNQSFIFETKIFKQKIKKLTMNTTIIRNVGFRGSS